MRTFFRAFKRAADRLDKTAGFDAPAGTRPYRSVGDVIGESKLVLDGLDEAVGFAQRGTYAVGSTLRDIDGNGEDATRLADRFATQVNKNETRVDMSDGTRLADVITDMASYVANGSTDVLLSSSNPPPWLEHKSREQRVIILAEVRRVIDIIGGIAVINTYATDMFERTTAEMWRIRRKVTEPDRKVVMEGFVDALTGVTRDGMITASVKGRNQLLSLIDTHFTPEQQRGILARIFG